MTFKKQLENAYQKKVVERHENAVRAVAFIVDATVVQMTPVDTGRARSNWLPSINTPSRLTVQPGGKTEMRSVIQGYKLSDTIYITNNLPYIERLNNGWSQQAPAGFVDMAINAGKQAVRRS